MLQKIPIPSHEFKKVLDVNKKVLFSGIFGSGKTTFLNDFFINDEKYESLHLYPVNYSIASNEDIFELIKYDILFQLISKVPKDEFLKLDIPYELTLYTYLTSTLDLQPKLDFLVSFLNFAGKYGTSSLKVYEQLKKLKDKFLEFHAKFQEDDFSKVKNYLNEAEKKKGHIYEEDFFTELIRILVARIKQQNGKEFVLVIDDLDRLDPEHIFRILNIFSAHIDFLGVKNQNKFDFDRIVLVCDYGNLKSIFKHKYGANTDFKGYINKFFDSPYWYDSSSLIREIIGTYISQIKCDLSYNIFNENKNLYNSLKTILSIFLDFGIISFRDLMSFQGKFELSNFNKLKQRNLSSNSILKRYNLDSEFLIYFLIIFFNNDTELTGAFERIKDRNVNFSERFIEGYYLENIAELVLLMNHLNISSNMLDDNLTLSYKEYSFEITVDRHSLNYHLSINNSKVMKNRLEVNHEKLDYFEFIEDAIKVYRKIGAR